MSASETRPDAVAGAEAQDEEILLAALEDARVEVAFVDATVSPHFGEHLLLPPHRGLVHTLQKEMQRATSPVTSGAAGRSMSG